MVGQFDVIQYEYGGFTLIGVERRTMKMRLKKMIVTTLLTTVIVAGSLGSVVEVQAACSNYTEYMKGISICDNTDGCGWFWLQDTKKHRSYQERYCSKDGKQVHEKRTVFVVDGCC